MITDIANDFSQIEIISDDIEKCYATIYNCSNIIVSNSSFAYFPCKTGTPKGNRSKILGQTLY